jgi:hypothetical protein
VAQAYVYEDDSTGWRHIQSGDIPGGAGSPLTTKGDLYGFDTANNRIPVGANNSVLTADSTQALGVKWAASGAGTISDLTSTGGTLTVTSPTGPTTNVDMPTTGVTAGTYGDATHVSEVTVDAEGRVTSASSVAISGSGGAGGLIVLYDSGYLGASSASIDTGAGGVASGHFGLIVMCYLRADTVVQLETVLLTFNNDASAIYGVNRIRNANTSVSGASAAASTSSQVGFVPAASQTAKYFGAVTLHIPAYDGTSNFKAGTSYAAADTDVVGNSDNQLLAFSYGSASAISRLAVAPATGGAKWIAGSRMIVYGVQ